MRLPTTTIPARGSLSAEIPRGRPATDPDRLAWSEESRPPPHTNRKKPCWLACWLCCVRGAQRRRPQA